MPEIIQLSDILPIPQSYLHEKYNIPLPEPGEPIARRQAQPLFSVPEGIVRKKKRTRKPASTKARQMPQSLTKRQRRKMRRQVAK